MVDEVLYAHGNQNQKIFASQCRSIFLHSAEYLCIAYNFTIFLLRQLIQIIQAIQALYMCPKNEMPAKRNDGKIAVDNNLPAVYPEQKSSGGLPVRKG